MSRPRRRSRRTALFSRPCTTSLHHPPTASKPSFLGRLAPALPLLSPRLPVWPRDPSGGAPTRPARCATPATNPQLPFPVCSERARVSRGLPTTATPIVHHICARTSTRTQRVVSSVSCLFQASTPILQPILQRKRTDHVGQHLRGGLWHHPPRAWRTPGHPAPPLIDRHIDRPSLSPARSPWT